LEETTFGLDENCYWSDWQVGRMGKGKQTPPKGLDRI